MSNPTFGSSHVPATAEPTCRLLTPMMLPPKGIRYHPNHLRRMWQRGDFPKPIRLSIHRIAWPEEVIDAWIREKIAASEKGAA
jgi:Prophage CP4-57 regulatory protein (AlpA)